MVDLPTSESVAPRVGVEKPALPAQHWVPSARLGSDRTRRTQAAPPANGKFDRARGPTQAPYSANSHRRIPPCSFHNLCQTADPVASPDEEGLASDAPLLPRDISVAKSQAGLHIISKNQHSRPMKYHGAQHQH